MLLSSEARLCSIKLALKSMLCQRFVTTTHLLAENSFEPCFHHMVLKVQPDQTLPQASVSHYKPDGQDGIAALSRRTAASKACFLLKLKTACSCLRNLLKASGASREKSYVRQIFFGGCISKKLATVQRLVITLLMHACSP